MKWAEVLRVTIPGEPVAKARPAIGKFGSYTTKAGKKTKAWEARAAGYVWAARNGPSILRDVPVRVEIDAVLKRPNAMFRKKDPDFRMLRPRGKDIDNIVKAVLDGVNLSGFWVDDAQVVMVSARKWTAAIKDRPSKTGEQPCLELIIYVPEV